MFKVYQNEKYEAGVSDKGIEWTLIGDCATFNEAHALAQKKICKDIDHEGGKDSIYWFSDNDDKEQGYQACIDSTGFMNHND